MAIPNFQWWIVTRKIIWKWIPWIGIEKAMRVDLHEL